MPTEAVAERLKSAQVVLSAIGEFHERALPKLEARPVAEGQPRPNYMEMLGSLTGQLTWAYNDLYMKDKAYVHEVAADSKHFFERDEVASILRDTIVRSRSIFEGCYRPKNIEEFGFPRNVSQDPEVLLPQGRHLTEQLVEPDLRLPDPLDEVLAVDPKVLATVITPKVDALDAVLTIVRKERRKHQLASLDRNEAIEFFDQTFTWVARTAESLFNLAGEKELAKRVRASSSRPGRTSTDPDELLKESGAEPLVLDEPLPSPDAGPGPETEPDSPV